MPIEIKDQTLFRKQAYINGRWVDSDLGDTFDVLNPANGELVARCANLAACRT